MQLYLDIERMRFEERLRTSFDIEDAALEAMLPAMLLQPLVENAIKYAVSPQEEGARISLSARVVGNRLRIAVEDTGPGLETPVQLSMLDPAIASNGATRSTTSTGVGLANIRNRLTQGYGDNHLFETRSQPGGGFAALIEIPYQPAETPAGKLANDAGPAPHRPAESVEAPQADNVINLNPQRAIGKS